MKKIGYFVLMAVVSVVLAACGTPATNNANTNANTTKPTAAAPTADALLALDKQANEAYIKGDGKFFEEAAQNPPHKKHGDKDRDERKRHGKNREAYFA